MGTLLGIRMTGGTAETEILENNLTKGLGIRMPDVLESVNTARPNLSQDKVACASPFSYS